MRNMSFALTPNQYKSGLKTVTRRNGWKFAKPGQICRGVNKVMGFKRGEKPVEYGQHVFLDSRFEPLRRLIDVPKYGEIEMVLEGFPGTPPEEFVEMYCKHNKVTPETEVNRIEFRRLLNMGEIPPTPPPFKCPICKADIEITEIDSWIETGFPGIFKADHVSIDCVMSPNIDSPDWEDWIGWHWSTPYVDWYVDWLPVSHLVERWVNRHWRFVDNKAS